MWRRVRCGCRPGWLRAYLFVLRDPKSGTGCFHTLKRFRGYCTSKGKQNMEPRYKPQGDVGGNAEVLWGGVEVTGGPGAEQSALASRVTWATPGEAVTVLLGLGGERNEPGGQWVRRPGEFSPLRRAGQGTPQARPLLRTSCSSLCTHGDPGWLPGPTVVTGCTSGSAPSPAGCLAMSGAGRGHRG